jgi:hypothetical protein
MLSHQRLRIFPRVWSYLGYVHSHLSLGYVDGIHG